MLVRFLSLNRGCLLHIASRKSRTTVKSVITVNARLGQGAVLGSSTEAGPTVYDLFIAIPAPVGASNGSLSGSYWVSSLEFPGGGLANIRNTNFKLTANGAGSFVE